MRSRWTNAFHKAYGKDAPYDLAMFVRFFKLPLKVLEEVQGRGFAAFAASKNKGKSTGYGWARARVHKFLLVHVQRYPLSDEDGDGDLHEIAWKDLEKKRRAAKGAW